MQYLSVADSGKMEYIGAQRKKLLCPRPCAWSISYRKTWSIPENAEKPERINKKKKSR